MPFEISFSELESKSKTSLPDISARNGKLYLNMAAHDSLHTIMAPHGEFLPVTHGGTKGFLFDPLSLAENHRALDEKTCIKNEFGEVESIGFLEVKLAGVDVFRTEFDNYMGIFCSQAFKDTVEKCRFQGLLFSVDATMPPSSGAESTLLQ